MVDAVLIGRDFAGKIGAWVAKQGFDVKSANAMQMAFSSEFPTPRLIGKGQTFIGGTTTASGEATATIGYGRSFSPPPFVAAVGMSSDWTLRLWFRTTAQLQYLQNQWHTPIFENPGAYRTNVYDLGGSHTVQLNSSSQGNHTGVPGTWASAKFVIRVYSDRVVFAGNSSGGIFVRYFILDVS